MARIIQISADVYVDDDYDYNLVNKAQAALENAGFEIAGIDIPYGWSLEEYWGETEGD